MRGSKLPNEHSPLVSFIQPVTDQSQVDGGGTLPPASQPLHPSENVSRSAKSADGGVTSDAHKIDWRQSLFDKTVVAPSLASSYGSVDEMHSSLLERCCPGDGILTAVVSLTTTAATPSMLSIPLAFVIGGWAFGIACIIYCMIVTFVSVRILALASISANSDDYETVSAFFLGSKGKWTLRIVLFFYSLGSAIVYLRFIMDSIAPIVDSYGTFLPHWLRGATGSSVFLLISMFAIAPMTFYSRLASLRTKGFVSNLTTVFIIVAIVYRYYFAADGTMRSDWSKAKAKSAAGHDNHAAASRNDAMDVVLDSPFSHTPLARALPYIFVAPIFMFSYEVQSNVMAVIKDMHDRSGNSILISTCVALVVISILYAVLGMYGSLTFPALASGNILTEYRESNDYLLIACQLMCCFSAAISYVFCIFPCRQAVYMFLSNSRGTKVPRRMRFRLGVSLSIISAFCAIVMPDVAVAVSILGALFSATICLTFPALFALKMHYSNTYLMSMVDLSLSWMLLISGIVFSILGTAISVAAVF